MINQTIPKVPNLKEKTAIELKYLGNAYKEISEKINVPESTITDWFSQRGKLLRPYLKYVKSMDEKRQKKIENEIAESDKNVLATTTNIMRKVGLDIQEQKLKLGTIDFERAWKIQRIMRGLPTRYEKKEIDASADDHEETMQALGLTPEDFRDENYAQTLKKVIEYYTEKNCRILQN